MAAPKTPTKKGAPTTYTDKLGRQVCEYIAEGLSLRRIAEIPGMPAKSTMLKWAVEDQGGFSDQYANARRIQAEALADEIFDIADDGTNDWVEKQDDNGGTADSILNHEHMQRSRLRVDTRKWYLSKVLPKVYGDKQQVENTHKFEGMADEELDARIKALENEIKSGD